MVQRVTTVAFEGIEIRPVDVQVQVAPGMPAFTIVGLPDGRLTDMVNLSRAKDAALSLATMALNRQQAA